MKIDKELIYENKFCKVYVVGTIYVLHSKRSNYNDQYHQTLDSLCKQAGLNKEAVIKFTAA